MVPPSGISCTVKIILVLWTHVRHILYARLCLIEVDTQTIQELPRLSMKWWHLAFVSQSDLCSRKFVPQILNCICLVEENFKLFNNLLWAKLWVLVHYFVKFLSVVHFLFTLTCLGYLVLPIPKVWPFWHRTSWLTTSLETTTKF